MRSSVHAYSSPKGPCSAHVFHLDPNAVHGYVRLVEDPAGWLWRHVDHETTLTIPGLERLDDVAVRWQPFTVGRDVDNRRLDLVQDEYRRPTVMMNRLLVVGLQRNLEHADPVVLEQNLVMFRRRLDGIQFRIPG